MAFVRAGVGSESSVSMHPFYVSTAAARTDMRGSIFMNKEATLMKNERRTRLRYEKHVATRELKKREKLQAYDNFDQIFTYENLYKSGKKIVLGVRWKESIQRYIAKKPTTVWMIYHKLHTGIYHPDPFFEFDLCERGKTRHIRSCSVRDRNVQRCLCDYSLVPAISGSFIYDNGASMKDKGYSFSVARITKFLRQYYRKHGSNGYILTYDFKKFFDNVDHDQIRRIISEAYTDERMRAIIMMFVDQFGERGLGLGSQVSQVLALASGNELDHFIKEKLGIKYYGRYMDDGYLIHESKEYLQDCLTKIQTVCNRLGITLNMNKTKISRIDKGFTYLKIRFFVTENGKVVKKIPKRSVVRMRRKLKKLKAKMDDGVLTASDVNASFQSWNAYANQFDAWHTRQNMRKLYYELFGQKGAITA